MWRPPNIPPLRIYFLDKDGWPVETIKGHPFVSLLRLILHTRRISTEWRITGVKWSTGTVHWHVSKEEIDNLVAESNRVWENTRANGFFMPYRPVMEPPRTMVDELSQRGFGRIVFMPILPPQTHIGLIGPIDAGGDDETENLMKPEE